MLSFLFFALIASANCLPSVDSLPLPSSAYSCVSNEDCIVAGDACRSCRPIAIHRNFNQKFNEADQAARRKTQCHISCEACSTQQLNLQCLNKKCQIIPNK